MIFDLVRDFADVLAAIPQEHPRYRILKLLDEAIRRDVHFIDRHPTTFFQCMWNTCWWYDCPELEHHYIESKKSVGVEKNGMDEESLYPLVEKWQCIKENCTPQFVWVRSRRPARFQLADGPDITLYAHTAYIESLAFDSSGVRLASGSRDGTVQVWDTSCYQPIFKLGPYEDWIRAIAFSPEGKQLAFASRNGAINVVDANSGIQLASLDTGVDVRSIAFSPDGKEFVAAFADATLKAWDCSAWQVKWLADNRGIKVTSLPLSIEKRNDISSSAHQKNSLTFHSIRYTPDGQFIMSGFGDGTVRVIHSRDGTEAFRHSPKGYRIVGPIRYSPVFNFSPDCKVFAAADAVLFPMLRSTQSAEALPVALCEHRDIISCMTFSTDGKMIGSSADSTTRVWAVDDGAELSCIHDRHSASLAFFPDGRHLAIGLADGLLEVWDVTHRRTRAKLVGAGEPTQEFIISVAFSPDGNQLVVEFHVDVLCWYTEIRIWDAVTGQFIRRVDEPASPFTRCRPTAVADAEQRRWSLVHQPGEVGICHYEESEPLGWFPVSAELIVGHPSDPVWAAGSRWSNHLLLFGLESSTIHARTEAP